MTYNGQDTTWVACAGGTDTETDKEPWFGKVIESEIRQDGSQWLTLIWLERCGKEIKGRYYQLCKDTQTTTIPAVCVILYGIEVHLQLHRKTQRRIFRVKTPVHLIKQIWKSKNKDVTFEQIVHQIKTDHHVDIISLDGVHRKFSKKRHIWSSDVDTAMCIYEAIRQE